MKRFILSLVIGALWASAWVYAQSMGSAQGIANSRTSTGGGTLGVAAGGTGLTAATDDTAMIGNGTAWQSKAIPDCPDTGGNHLNYDASTNAFSCGTS